MNNTLTGEIIGNVLWQVRMIRCTKSADLSPEGVQREQRYTWGYDLETVEAALAEIKARGYQWDRCFVGIPDTCIALEKGE